MDIRRATAADLAAVAQLALALWPDNEPAGLQEEFTDLLRDQEAAVFLALEEGKPAGFAQCQLRHDYVEGACSSPVGYLEGVYVCPQARRRGIARTLLALCEGWARGQGCREFASDCVLDNVQSQAFHRGVGFVERNRIVCYAKPLEEAGE